MDLEKELLNLGVETQEARRVANLIESMNENELVYFVAFFAGMKVGERINEKRRKTT